jgi:hypothetical protein
MVYDFTFIEQDEADVGTQFYKSMDFVSQLVYAFFMKIPPAPSTKGGGEADPEKRGFNRTRFGILKTQTLTPAFLLERNYAMPEEFTSSTVTDTEFDVVDELKATVTDLEKELKPSGTKKIIEKFSYLKFLINELDDTLSGEFETLRRKRFITKKTR